MDEYLQVGDSPEHRCRILSEMMHNVNLSQVTVAVDTESPSTELEWAFSNAALHERSCRRVGSP